MEKTGIVVTALVPCLIILYFIVSALRKGKSPTSYREVILCIVLSLVSILFLGLWSWVIDHWRTLFTHQLAYGFYEAFLLAAIPEELSRYVILRWRLSRLPRPIDLTKCLLLGCLVGLTFGTAEHVAFCLGEGWTSCWQRILVNVPYHTFAGAIIGYFVGLAIIKRKEIWGLIGLTITIILHGINNFNLRRLFETVPEHDHVGQVVEHTPGWLEAILITHWPSNILVTLTTTVLAFILFRKARKAAQLLIPANSSP